MPWPGRDDRIAHGRPRGPDALVRGRRRPVRRPARLGPGQHRPLGRASRGRTAVRRASVPGVRGPALPSVDPPGPAAATLPVDPPRVRARLQPATTVATGAWLDRPAAREDGRDGGDRRAGGPGRRLRLRTRALCNPGRVHAQRPAVALPQGVRHHGRHGAARLWHDVARKLLGLGRRRTAAARLRQSDLRMGPRRGSFPAGAHRRCHGPELDGRHGKPATRVGVRVYGASWTTSSRDAAP